MAADDYLRMAWQALREGRSKLREAMLTLAIGESGPGDAWAERCRSRLLRDRPDHFLGAHPTLARAMADPRVGRALDRLRAQYPPARVRWLLLKAEVASGPFVSEPTPIAGVIVDLIGPAAEAEVRRDVAQAVQGPKSRTRAAVPAGPIAVATGWLGRDRQDGPDSDSEPEEPSVEAFYGAVLLSIAMLMATTGRGRHAA